MEADYQGDQNFRSFAKICLASSVISRCCSGFLWKDVFQAFNRCEIWEGGHADYVGQDYLAPITAFCHSRALRHCGGKLDAFVRAFRTAEIQGVAVAFDLNDGTCGFCVDELNLGWIGGLYIAW